MPISYNQPDYTYNQTGIIYNQIAVVRTASGSGTGTSSTTTLLVAKRTALSIAESDSTAATKVTQLRLGALTDFGFPCAETRAEVERVVKSGDLTKAQAAALMTVTGWIRGTVAITGWPADLTVPPSPAPKRQGVAR